LNKSFSGILTGLLLLLVFFFVNAIAKSATSGWFLDFSEENLYSLSEGSERILERLEQPVTLKYFFSKTDSSSIPALSVYSDRVLALLRQYKKASGNKLDLEVLDPRPDSEDEDWANRFGLRPLTLGNGEQIYFGLVGISSSGVEKIIPNIDLNNQDQLEYQVTGLIQSLVQEGRPRAGLVSSLNLTPSGSQIPGGQNGWIAIEQLKELLDVEFIEAEAKELPADIEVLAVIHPKNLSEELRYSIDQFVLGGGRLIVMTDPFCQLDLPPAEHQQAKPWDNSSSLNSLTTAWGLELNEGFAVADSGRSTGIQTQRGAPPEEFVMWISLKGEDLSQEEVISSGLESVVFPWAGHLKIHENDGVRITPIAESSELGNLVPVSELMGMGGRPDQLLKKYSSAGEKRLVAARIEGKLKSNFSNPPASIAQGQSIQHLTESKGVSNVLVVADVDFIADPYSVVLQNSPFGGQVAIRINDNLPMFLNALENMSGSNELISIRSRGKVSRPFTLVQDIEKDAQLRWRQEEEVFQARLNEANLRLSQFEKEGADNQVFSTAVMTELENLRREKAEAQQSLRKVRRNLREDVEKLGSNLFLINTFLVPLIVLISYFVLLATNRNN